MSSAQKAWEVMSEHPAAITCDPERLSGAAVIGMSRVPVSALLDNFAEGHDLERFLKSFPSVTHEECVAALDYLKELMEAGKLPELLHS